MPSHEKLEKVVYPPHIPVIRNNRHSRLNQAYREAIPYSNPMRKHPEILTRKVPSGKVMVTYLPTKTVIRYLQMLPMAPPDPISNNGFMPKFTPRPIKSKFFSCRRML